jgi:SET domain-containing protein
MSYKAYKRWINPKIEVKISPLGGIGIFAKDKIVKGEIIGIPAGILIEKKDWLDYTKENGDLGMQIDDNFFLCPESREDVEKIGAVNHSCNPNTGMDGTLLNVAMRDIEQGEECTVDYGTCFSFHKEFGCNCGTENCRKKITSEDWKIDELQNRLGDYFSYFLKKKINKK